MDGKKYSDAQLITAAKSGDMQAVYALYRANMPLILKYAHRYAFIDAAVSVDDLTQEAWFAILRAVRQFDPARGTWAQVLVWAIKQQYRDCMRLYKRNRPKMVSLDQAAPEDETAALMDCVVDKSASAYVQTLHENFRACVRRTLLKELDERTANTIIRHDLESEDLHSIARSLNLSYNTTTSNRRHALLRLRRSHQLRELYRDALEIDSITYHSSAEACALLLMKPKGISDAKGGGV